MAGRLASGRKLLQVRGRRSNNGLNRIWTGVSTCGRRTKTSHQMKGSPKGKLQKIARYLTQPSVRGSQGSEEEEEEEK